MAEEIKEEEEKKQSKLGEALEADGYTGVSKYFKAFGMGVNGTTEKFLENKRDEEKLKLKEQEDKAKAIRDQNLALSEKNNKSLLDQQKSIESYNSEKNKIMNSDKYKDESSRMSAVNNLNKTFEKGMSTYNNIIQQTTSSMTDMNLVENYSSMSKNLNQGLDFSTYGSVEVDGKKVNLTSSAIEQFSANPNQFGLGEDNIVYFKNKNGDLTDQALASHVSFKGLQDNSDVESIKAWNKEEKKYDLFENNRDFNNAYNSNPNIYDLNYSPSNEDNNGLKLKNLNEDATDISNQIDLKKEELANAKQLKQNKKSNQIKAEISKLNSQFNKINNERTSRGGSTPNKPAMNKIKHKHNPKNKNKESYSKNDIAKDLYDVSVNKLIDFSDNTDSKSVSTMIAEVGSEEINNMINKSYRENGDEKTESTFIPLLKAESTIGATDLVTNKIYSDKKLSMMNFFIDEEEGGVPLTEKIAKMSEFVNRFKSGTGNKKTINYIYEKNIKPIEYGLKGKSVEIYEDDWKTASKNFNNKYTSLFSDLPLATKFSKDSVGFEDFSEAVASLQDYINDYDNGLGNLVRDVFGDDEDDMSRFMNNTFPKLQIANMVLNGGEGEVLNPIDLMEMIAGGYRAGSFGDEMGAKVKRGSKLEELLQASQFIKY